LLDALEDGDHQVEHLAAQALEAIQGIEDDEDEPHRRTA
jgi:hypothetical protein